MVELVVYLVRARLLSLCRLPRTVMVVWVVAFTVQSTRLSFLIVLFVVQTLGMPACRRLLARKYRPLYRLAFSVCFRLPCAADFRLVQSALSIIAELLLSARCMLLLKLKSSIGAAMISTFVVLVRVRLLGASVTDISFSRATL